MKILGNRLFGQKVLRLANRLYKTGFAGIFDALRVTKIILILTRGRRHENCSIETIGHRSGGNIGETASFLEISKQHKVDG